MTFQIYNPTRWYLHPVFIFACSIISLATALILTIYWYMDITAALEVIVKKFHIDPGQVFPSRTGMTILVLTLLVTVVLTGILLAFIYYQRTVRLFRLQHNFIYNFTHELKTPVTSMKLYLESFLRHSLAEGEIRKYSRFMLEDVARLTDNINSILNLARIESGRFSDENDRFNLVAFIREFCSRNESLFRSCRIEVESPEPDLRYPVNKLLFEMLLMNIIANAVKYNDSDDPQLRILFRPGRQRLRIHFIDNGIGIEKQEIDKIFRKFYQAPGSRGDQGVKGSGLGLYLVFSIARIHGWRVTARSEGRGRGAVFTLHLPAEGSAALKGKQLWKKITQSASWS